MFDGIIILNTEKVPTAYGWGWHPASWIFIGLIILGLAIIVYTIITTHKKKLDHDDEVTRCTVMGIAFCAVILDQLLQLF